MNRRGRWSNDERNGNTSKVCVPRKRATYSIVSTMQKRNSPFTNSIFLSWLLSPNAMNSPQCIFYGMDWIPCLPLIPYTLYMHCIASNRILVMIIIKMLRHSARDKLNSSIFYSERIIWRQLLAVIHQFRSYLVRSKIEPVANHVRYEWN